MYLFLYQVLFFPIDVIGKLENVQVLVIKSCTLLIAICVFLFPTHHDFCLKLPCIDYIIVSIILR